MKKKILMALSFVFILMSVTSCDNLQSTKIASYTRGSYDDTSYELRYFKDKETLFNFFKGNNLIDTAGQELNAYWESEVMEYIDKCIDDVDEFYDDFSSDVMNVLVDLKANFTPRNGYYLVLKKEHYETIKTSWEIDNLYYVEFLKNRKIFSTLRDANNEEPKYLEPYEPWHAKDWVF